MMQHKKEREKKETRRGQGETFMPEGGRKRLGNGRKASRRMEEK